MGPLEPLSPDQRAVVALVLQQGRSYEEIAALLAIPAAAVRARAHAGLAALATDDGLPGEVTGPLADFLLGQQPERDAAATRGLLAESAPARAWATDVAGRLRDIAAHGLPEIPHGSDRAEPRSDAPRSDTARSDAARSDAPQAAAAAPRPQPAASQRAGGGAPAASRLGGALLIAGVVAIVAVVLFLVLRGGGDAADEQAASSATPAATATPAASAAPPQVADRIRLTAPAGGNASGMMTFYLQDDRLLFELVAQDLPPSDASSAYAIWLTGPGDRARRLGFATVGQEGRLGIQGPSDKDLARFPKLYATYANVVVSRETTQDASSPGEVVLTGKLPQGR